MYTCCPHCHTCFRITKAQLEVAQGKVRCGHCKQVFNGKQHLRDEIPGQQSESVTASTPPPIAPPPESNSSQPEEDFGKASDIDFDLFDFSSIPDDQEVEEVRLEDTAMTLVENDDLDFDAWLTEDELEEEDVTASPDEPYEEIDKIFDELDEDQEEEVSYTTPETETEVEEPDNLSASRYAYIDPEDMQGEQQDIEKFIEEMNAQLADMAEQPINIQVFDANVVADLFATPEPDSENSTPPEEQAPSQPAASTTDDDFKQAFLANLDSSRALQPNSSEPSSPKPQPEPVSKPQPVTDNPAATSGLAKVSDAEETEAIPLRLRDSLAVETKPRRPLMLILGILAILLFSATLLGQLAFFRSSQLLDRFPALQPVVERICSVLPCRYAGPRDISQIKLVNRDIRLHPSVNNALLINATFINRATFKQPYPDITITLSDLSGAIVAQRRFTPAEYLGRLNKPFILMPSGKPVQIALEVIDPGKDAVNFEFTFQ
jgi:predicted Zn finger-like uncharacterized protein